MRILDLGTATAATANPSFPTNGLGFLPGETAKVEIFSPDAAFAGTAQVQTSPDNSVWTSVGPVLSGGGFNTAMIQLSNYVRLNPTARTAGTVRAVLVNEIG